MKTLRLTGFGIRGFVGDALSPEVVIDFAAAFGTFVGGGRVLVGRDTRASSRMFHSAVISGLTSTGCDTLDFGVCPTPILQFSVDRYGAVGAISISAGHTRMGWNALTLIGADGAVIDPLGGETVLDVYHARDFAYRPWNEVGGEEQATDFAAPYFDALEARIDADAIRRAGLTVLIDPVNGAGCGYIGAFAARLGLKLVPLNAEESGYLAHDPEPRPRNARPLASIIRTVRGDIGFVLSSDMGRLSIVSEDGETASEEYTFALIAEHVLGKRSGVLVTNCCTTRTVDDIAKLHGCPVVKTPVGQAYVVAALQDEAGVIGGEGNGSVVLPEFSRAFDGFLMMALILEAMAETGCKASGMLAAQRRYHIVKRQVSGEARRGYHALEALLEDRDWMGDGRVNLTDGIRVDWDTGWIHMRASRTEPLVRIISESRSQQEAENRAVDLARRVEELL